jgi:outer membrane protein OmpA-like peptidoglycan-associated protein/tetratricopeptide (TPR) repeat protein
MKHSLVAFILTIGLILAATSPTFAQKKKKPSDYGIKSKKALSAFENGNEQTRYRDYPRAIESFQVAVELEPTFGEAWIQMGGSYFVIKEYEKAYEALLKAKEHLNSPNAMVYFYLGECALRMNLFAEALENYEAFLNPEPVLAPRIIADAKIGRDKAKFAVEATKNAIKFEPINLGEGINTVFDEYLPYLTADGLTIFFTTRRPGCTGGYNREYRDYLEDFYYSEFKDGKWQRAENLGPPVNTDNNEGAASFTPDGQYVYFTGCGRRDGFGSCDIYVSKLDGNTWLPPKNLGPLVNSSSWESQPCISNDGRTLYFSSNRAGGLGNHDIWYCTRENGRWTEPQNAGAPINTPGNEYSPFLHADGITLYFSSDKHPGFGSLDLFMSKRTNEGWTNPTNLGYPLNTSAAEGNIFVNTKGDRGYINSSREGSLGKSDIYQFELDESIRPNYTTYVRGLVKEKGTGTLLQAEVTFINIETRDTIRSVSTNSATGRFLLTLPLEQDYAAYVNRKGYLFASESFSLKNINSKETPYFDVEIELEKLEVGREVIMSSIFYESDKFDLMDRSKAELENLVQFMIRNPMVKIEIGGHTDDVGTDQYNRDLSRSRSDKVREYLASRGININRIEAEGYGEAKPIADNETEEGRARNRRTVCRIIGL